MQAVAAAMTDEEIDETAKYFSQQKLGRRVWVVEGINIPRAEPSDWVYKEVSGSEDLDERLLEVAPDIARHQRRDDRMQYTAYAPPGSLARGKRLATTGLDLDKTSKTQICATCHLANLKGTDKVPPIAGRSPTYLLRQLLAYKNGDRKRRGRRADGADGREARARGHGGARGLRGFAVSLDLRPCRASPPASATPRLSMSTRVPRSRLPPSSKPSRKACCSVSTSFVPLPASTNSTLASDTEIFLPCQYMS